MIKIILDATCISSTVQGRLISNYISTPISDPIPDNIIKVMNSHLREIQQMISTFGTNTLQFNIKLVNDNKNCI